MECLDLYFKDVKAIPVLSKDVERGLFEEMKKGSIAARNKLLESQLKLIISFVKKYKFDNDDFAELIQICNAAMLRRIYGFNPDRGRLSTYLAMCVNGAVLDYHKKLKSKYKEVSLEECFEEAEQSNPVYPEVYSSLSDQDIDGIMDSLPEEDRKVLNYTLGLDEEHISLNKTGMKMGLPKEKVRQIKKKALKKLKIIMKRNGQIA